MESIRVLTDDGSLFIHLDYRTVHHVYCLVDKLFSSALQMMNEIIWAYDYGGRSKKYWPRKHDTILWYVRDPDNYVYNYAAIDRIPYLAPGLCGPDKEAIGKVPTDVWWHTIVCGHEKTGYPTQKPVELLRRIVAVHSRPGDVVLDFFAGSGTTGEAAGRLGRGYIMVDNNPQAITIMERRLAYYR
jgi:site-specific DNA-methyltransferase (adenine-specific)